MGKIGIIAGMVLLAAAATAAAVPLGAATPQGGWTKAPSDQLCNYCEEYGAISKARAAVRTSYRVGTGYAPDPGLRAASLAAIGK